MKNFVFYYFLLLTTLLGQMAMSQEAGRLDPHQVYNMSLEEMLNVKIHVSSTIPKEIFNTPSAVTVIDREIIDQYNFLSVAEAVRMVAGVEILQTVIDKNVPTIRGVLQNFYANKVLILINNIPTWQPTYGNGTLDRISINDVDRIEVLKGPASVLYGTNAYSGVINLILRQPESTQVHASILGGYPDHGGASFNITQQEGEFSWNVSGNAVFEKRKPYLLQLGADTLKIDETIFHEGEEFEHQSMLYENDTLFYYNEEYKKYNFNVRLNYKAHELYLNNFVNSFTHPGAYATYQSGGNRQLLDKGSLLAYTYAKVLNPKTSIRVNGNYEYFYRDFILTQAEPQSARFSSYRLNGSIKINHRFSDNLDFEFGSEITNGHNLGHNIISNLLNNGIHMNIKNDKDILESALFSQANYVYKKFSLLAGLRYTYNRNFGSNLSPRISSMIKLNKRNSLKLIIGQSFRTPNMLELYFDHSTVVGNSELEPEKCTSYEMMYLTQRSKFFAQFTAYYSQYSHLIQRVTSTNINEPAVYRNVSSFDGYGAEVELKYQNPKVINTMLNYNYITGKGQEAESNYQYVPKHTLSIGINKPINNYFISANSYAYSKTQGPWENINGQMMVDLHVGYKQLAKSGMKITHTLSAKNITESDMLVAEYIRKRPGVNVLPTSGYGRRLIYTLKLVF